MGDLVEGKDPYDFFDCPDGRRLTARIVPMDS